MKKITVAMLAIIAIASFYSVCCTVNQHREVNYDISTKRNVEVHEDKRREAIIKRNVKPGYDFNDVARMVNAEMIFPHQQWTRVNPELTDWNITKLEKAKAFYEALNADACMIIQNGYVISAWGDISEPIENRSIRKAFLSSLFGIYHGKGEIQLDETLAEMGIDEKGGLTDTEKTATVHHLLASRSCIFLPAAYDPNDHPERGKYKPGEVWSYNNWDFNALGTIFEKETGRKIFETFQQEIAAPLQMQDFKLENTEYHYENKSLHPAYLFETSARDDARMGLLWLNNGKWKDQQIIPEQWMEKSTSLITDFKGNNGGLSLRDGYGYLFWVDKTEAGRVQGYSALGASGQYIYVNPDHKLVVVLRADPGSIFKKWFGMRLDPKDSYKLVDLILDASPDAI